MKFLPLALCVGVVLIAAPARADDCPASLHYYRRALSIPLFPQLTDADQERVVQVLADALAPAPVR